MTAIIIILSVLCLLALILFLPIGVQLSYSPESYTVKLSAGIIKIKLLPKKDRSTSSLVKKGKKLRGMRISDISFNEPPSNKAKKEVKTKKLRFARRGNSVDDLISYISEMNDDPEMLRLFLMALKELALRFKKGLYINIRTLCAEINVGDAAKTCITCGALQGALSAFLEALDNCTCLSLPTPQKIGIYPSFFDKGNRISISLSIKIRMITVIGAFFASVADNIKIPKRYVPVKKGQKK